MEPKYTPAWIPWSNDEGGPGSMRRLITLLGNRTDVTLVSNQSNSFRAAAEDGLAVAGKRGHTLTPRSRSTAPSQPIVVALWPLLEAMCLELARIGGQARRQRFPAASMCSMSGASSSAACAAVTRTSR